MEGKEQLLLGLIRGLLGAALHVLALIICQLSVNLPLRSRGEEGTEMA